MSQGSLPRFGVWRRTLCVGCMVGGALLATSVTGAGVSGAQDAAFNNGLGLATGSGSRLNPVAGGLSFGVGFGESLAGHQNTVGTAESRSANTGVIGVTLAAEGCSGGDPTLPAEQQPGTLRRSSAEADAAGGVQDEDPLVPGVTRYVRANPDPYAESITTSAGLDIPGVMSTGATVTTAHSGVFGDYREAIATVDISDISFAGVVNVSNMHWQAIHRTGSIEEQTGSFTMGEVTGPGALVPAGTIDSIEELNEVIGVLGFEMRAPTFHLDTTGAGTISTVDPLTIALVPAAARDELLGPIFGVVQPARQTVTDGLIAADCSFASGVTVIDIILAATGAGGEFGIELGGVQATTAPITLFSGLGSLPPLSPLGAAPGTAGTPAIPGTPGGSSTGATVGSGATGTAAAPIPAAVAAEGRVTDPIGFDTPDGERGGAMAAVGGGGLLALLAAADGDRRKMRRAQREIPLET